MTRINTLVFKNTTQILMASLRFSELIFMHLYTELFRKETFLYNSDG